MDELQALLAGIHRRDPPAPEALHRLASATGFTLPEDYLSFMASSNGGEGDVGDAWLEIWPIERVESELKSGSPHYEGVVLFAGNGANTVYGFDRFRDGEIVEGDWIGLSRDEMISHGATLSEFLRSIGA